MDLCENPLLRKRNKKVVMIDQYRFKVQIPNIIAYYPFNGNTNDESGNGHNLINGGATLTLDRHGNADKAYQFDGVNDSMSVTSIDLSAIGNQFSLAFWVKFDVLTGDRVLFNLPDSVLTDNTFYMAKQNTGLFRLLINQTDYSNSAITVNVNTTDWFHFILTLDYNGISTVTLNLYKNNVSIFSTTFSRTAANLFDFTSSFVIGQLVTGSRFHSGKLDDIYLIGRVLTSYERTLLFNE